MVRFNCNIRFAQESITRKICREYFYLGNVDTDIDNQTIPNSKKSIIEIRVDDDSIIAKESGISKPAALFALKKLDMEEGDIFLLGDHKIIIEDTSNLLDFFVKSKGKTKRYRLSIDEDGYYIGNEESCSILLDINKDKFKIFEDNIVNLVSRKDRNYKYKIIYDQEEKRWKITSEQKKIWKYFYNTRPSKLREVTFTNEAKLKLGSYKISINIETS